MSGRKEGWDEMLGLMEVVQFAKWVYDGDELPFKCRCCYIFELNCFGLEMACHDFWRVWSLQLMVADKDIRLQGTWHTWQIYNGHNCSWCIVVVY